MNGITRAVKIAGSQKLLAQLLGIKPQTVSWWVSVKKGKLPISRAIEIEVVLDGKVTRHDLRPDIFGKSQSTTVNPALPSESGENAEDDIAVCGQPKGKPNDTQVCSMSKNKPRSQRENLTPSPALSLRDQTTGAAV